MAKYDKISNLETRVKKQKHKFTVWGRKFVKKCLEVKQRQSIRLPTSPQSRAKATEKTIIACKKKKSEFNE